MENKYENENTQTVYGQNSNGQNHYGTGSVGPDSYGAGSNGQSSYGTNNYGQNVNSQSRYDYSQNVNQQNRYDYSQNGSNQNRYDYSQNINNQNRYDYSQNINNQNRYDYSQNVNNQNRYDYSQNGYSGAGGWNSGQGMYGSGYGQGNGNTMYNTMPGQRIFSPTAATEAVRESGKSFPFLFGTICYTLALILSIAGLFFNGQGNGMLKIYFGGSSAFSVVVNIIAMIPLFLIVIGMWLFFASCAGRQKVPSTVGLTLNRGAIITYIVLVSLLLAIFAVAAGIIIFALVVTGQAVDSVFYVNGMRVDFTGSVVMVFLILAVALAVIILMLIYYIKMLKTTRVIRSVLRTGKVTGNISMYHIVFNFIAVILNIYMMIVNFIFAAYVADAMPAAIQSALSIISYISVTVALLMLRSKLKPLIQDDML